jgi:hypothetical protein
MATEDCDNRAPRWRTLMDRYPYICAAFSSGNVNRKTATAREQFPSNPSAKRFDDRAGDREAKFSALRLGIGRRLGSACPAPVPAADTSTKRHLRGQC